MIHNRTGLATLAKREILRFFVVASQTVVPPLVSSTLFLLVFGLSIGGRIDFAPVTGGRYLDFLVPGLVMMHLIEAPYTNTSSSLFMSRWHNHIQEVLLSPLSYFEMTLGLLSGGIVRGLVCAAGVYCVSLGFTRFPVHAPWVVLYFALGVTFIFSCLGLLAGLWATSFEKLSACTTFVLTPLIYLGGVFHSVQMIPEPLRSLSKFNPILYLVSGLRYGMIGQSDVHVGVAAVLVAVVAVALFALVVHLFRIGYRLRS